MVHQLVYSIQKNFLITEKLDFWKQFLYEGLECFTKQQLNFRLNKVTNYVMTENIN